MAYRHGVYVSVSIHAPAGGATSGCLSSNGGSEFQSTRLREARQATNTPLSQSEWFQSTRLREARLHIVVGIGHAWRVSIHAPAGGATLNITIPKSGCRFQSTRLREARPNCHP